MSIESSQTLDTETPPARVGWLRRCLHNCQTGKLTIELPSGEKLIHGGRTAGPEAHIAMRQWAAIRRLILGGDIGFAEAYRRGEWWSCDLIEFFNWVSANEGALAMAWRGSFILRQLERFRHACRANTRRGSRRNISAHYDLGNAFYQAWLDAGMNYSSAIFGQKDLTLEAAQQRKLDRVLQLLNLKPRSSILEIGCGWGAFAEAAISAVPGSTYTGVTLSAEQLQYTQHRLSQVSGDDRAKVSLTDYRDVQGRFDGIVSIEMIEAVGERYWPDYFRQLRERLREGGRAVIQAITIDEDRFDSYRGRPDFIQLYIFPGGMLPTKDLIRTHAEAAGLKQTRSEQFALSYAETLAIWRKRFLSAWPQLQEMGYDQAFRHVWEYYLAYCETGFRNGTLDVGLYVFE